MSAEFEYNNRNQNDDNVDKNVDLQIPHYVIEDTLKAASTMEKNVFQRFVHKHQVYFYYIRLAILNIVFISYFISASIFWNTDKINPDWNWCSGFGMLVLIYCFAYGRLFYIYGLKGYCLKLFKQLCRPYVRYLIKYSKLIEISICLLFAIGVVIFLTIDTVTSRKRLTGFLGIFSLLILGWIFSKYPLQIKWRPVIWGLIIQFVFGLISIRWTIGRNVFQCLSEKIATFLDFAKDGATFVFSEDLVATNVFAFTVLPVLFYFSFVVQILNYLGILQYVIKQAGWVLYAILGTTACESLHAATTLFLGMPESFLVIEPYLNKLTGSEIHAIMCSCFATTSGTVMAAYISFGAQPVHLITATVMSAPAGLCFAKLLYPETQTSSTQFNNIVLKKSEESSLLDAATKGALSAIPLILGIIANIIAFVSAITFLNAIFTWLGALVGFPDVTFESILAKVFIPVSYAIGVPWNECEDVGTLIGLKTVVNEFVAYQKLGQFKAEGKLTMRAEAIATYAICGFSNPGAIGIIIGSLSTMAPNKTKDIVDAVVRAFFGGCAVCFLTASIAGMLIDEDTFLSNDGLLPIQSL